MKMAAPHWCESQMHDHTTRKAAVSARRRTCRGGGRRGRFGCHRHGFGSRSQLRFPTAQKVSEGDFRTKLINNLKPALDKAVTDKKLTADQETAILNRLKTGPLPLWNAHTPKPKPATSATPSAP